MLVAMDKGPFTRSLRPIKDGADIRPIAEYLNANEQAVTASIPVTNEQKLELSEILSDANLTMDQRIASAKILTRKGK